MPLPLAIPAAIALGTKLLPLITKVAPKIKALGGLLTKHKGKMGALSLVTQLLLAKQRSNEQQAITMLRKGKPKRKPKGGKKRGSTMPRRKAKAKTKRKTVRKARKR